MILINPELETCDSAVESFIYLDNNIYRLLKRNENGIWYALINHLNLQSSRFIFTWSQLLEDLDLGGVIKNIKTTDIWKKKLNTDRVNAFFKQDANRVLDLYFDVIVEIIESGSCLDLARDALLLQIDSQYKYFREETAILAQETISRTRDFIASDVYVHDLASTLAWNIIIKHSFIANQSQWDMRKSYFESLINGWYKLFLQGYDFNIFPLLQNYYLTNPDHKLSDQSIYKIKEQGDLCDGELIEFSFLGFTNKNTLSKIKVIGVTCDNSFAISQRMNFMSSALHSMKRDIEGWEIKTTPGEIICIDRSKGINFTTYNASDFLDRKHP
jgi:hypothetical protein